MRFPWQEQQLLVRSMLERWVADRGGAKTARQGPASFDRAAWKELAELGVLGLAFVEEDGGSGGDALDTAIVMEALGRGLVRLPYLSSVVLAGGLIRSAGSAEQKARLLPPLLAGDLLLAFGFAEAGSRYTPGDVSTRATRDGDGYRLSGRKIAVLGAPDAEQILVSARTAGERRDAEDISLFLVLANAVRLSPYTTIDGQTAAELALDDVRLPVTALIGEEGAALPIIERVLDEATAALCADTIGAMRALNERCLDLVRTRNAFGQPIANFQAIQHRLVDMQIAYEMASALTLKAASHLAEGVADASRAVSACKALVNEEAAFVGKTAVQMHGAIGITEELDVGHYFKRLTAMQLLFGSHDHHLRRCIDFDRARSLPKVPHGH